MDIYDRDVAYIVRLLLSYEQHCSVQGLANYISSKSCTLYVYGYNMDVYRYKGYPCTIPTALLRYRRRANLANGRKGSRGAKQFFYFFIFLFFLNQIYIRYKPAALKFFPLKYPCPFSGYFAPRKALPGESLPHYFTILLLYWFYIY